MLLLPRPLFNLADMAKQQKRSVKAPTTSSPFEEARDELFQHIMRCGVVGSDPEHAQEWFTDTMAYMKDRYPELDAGFTGVVLTLQPGPEFHKGGQKPSFVQALAHRLHDVKQVAR